MFGARTKHYALGKYTAASRPLDPITDWTENFALIDATMWENESTAEATADTVNTMLGEIEEQHTIVDGINTRVATTATKFTTTGNTLSNVRVTVSQASTIAGGALSTATSAQSTANAAQSSANSALSMASEQVTQLASLRNRILILEQNQEGETN